MLEVQMFFELDTTPCPFFDLDEVTVFPALTSWPDDCRYEHVRRRDFDVAVSHARVDVDARLPRGEVAADQPAGEPEPMLRVFRYSDQVRMSVRAWEWDPIGAYDRMGGAVGKFGPRSYFGLGTGRDPLVPGDAQHSFDTCRDSGSCFSTTFHLRVVPARKQQGRNLEVYEVVGPDNCVGGEPYTWSVSLRNPERRASDRYVVTIGLLDPEGILVHEWHSAPQTTPIGPLGPRGRVESVAVPNVRLGGLAGEHRLAVFARSIETDPDFMATAVETTIRCSFSPRVDPVREDLFPGQSPTATPRLRQPGIEVPRVTPTPTSRLRLPDRELEVPTPTPASRLRLPEFERVLPTATPTPVPRGPGTTIRMPAPTPTPEDSDVRGPLLR